MPPDGPQTVYDVLSRFNPSIAGKKVDLNATFTTAFVQQAAKDVR
jgi:hypothetical protein